MSESSDQRKTDSTSAMPAERVHSWVAMELHDGLMQWVFSARMQLERLEKDLEHSDKPQQLQQVQSIGKVISSALKEGRGLIGFLEGTAGIGARAKKHWLEGLLAFISLVEIDAQKTGHELAIDANPSHWPELTDLQAWNLSRVVQQAVSNAIQHAGPCSISIRPRINQQIFEVEIRDDGAGFDSAESVETGHFGLSGMEHRAHLLSGELQVESQVGQGTTIRLRFEPESE